jgi:polysaccharide biosynthesis transport protein
MLDKTSKPSLESVTRKAEHVTKGQAMLSFCLGSLRSGKRRVAINAIAFLAIGLLYVAVVPKSYTASSDFLVYIEEIQTGADLAILPGRGDLPLVLNQIELIQSGNVLTKVLASLENSANGADQQRSEADSTNKGYDLALPPPGSGAAFNSALENLRRKLTVRQIGTSHMINVAYKASDPQKAARVVNTVTQVYLQELTRASHAAGSHRATAIPELYQSLGPSAFLVTPGQPPTTPDGPSAAFILLGSALFGLCVGAAVAILREALSDTIRSARQVEYALGMNCLEVIPAGVATAAEDLTQGPCALQHGPLRRLMASTLEASLTDRRIVGVTSAVPGEGASTVAIGLARAVAALGKRTLLIDGDPDGRSVSHWAANSPPVGAGARPDLTAGGFDALVEPEAGLHVLTRRALFNSNALPLRPPDALLSSAAGYHMVIVDMPSLAAGPDVRASSPWVDGYLLVVKWGATESELVRQALRTVGDARPKFIGAILNMADEQKMAIFGWQSPPRPTLRPFEAVSF